MPLVFYDASIAPSPRRIRLMLALKAIPHDSVEIDIKNHEQMGDAYRSINPDCTVPALKLEDGTVLTNVAAIATWLETEYPEPALCGTTALEKADIAGWVSATEQQLGAAIPNALRNSNPYFKDRALPGADNHAQIPALAERGLSMIDSFMGRLDSHLETRDYIAAGQLSFADITALCFLDFCKIVGKKINSDTQPNLAAWRARLAENDLLNL